MPLRLAPELPVTTNQDRSQRELPATGTAAGIEGSFTTRFVSAAAVQVILRPEASPIRVQRPKYTLTLLIY